MIGPENFLECRCFLLDVYLETSVDKYQVFLKLPGSWSFLQQMTTHTEAKHGAGDNEVTFADERNYFLTWKNRIKVAVEQQNGDCKGRLCGHGYRLK